MGASGNVGACVTRQLVARGDDVRVLLRRSSSTRGIDGLDVQRCYGDIFDTEAVAAAMAERDVVYYCVVDTRAELRDPAPLFKTNVEGLHNVLDVAAKAGLHRFVFLSTIGTIALGRSRRGRSQAAAHRRTDGARACMWAPRRCGRCTAGSRRPVHRDGRQTAGIDLPC